MEGERLRRFQLMGLPNRQLEIILGRNLHAKKTTLVDLIIEQEYYSA
jgi:predicted ABC-class ATPase